MEETENFGKNFKPELLFEEIIEKYQAELSESNFDSHGSAGNKKNSIYSGFNASSSHLSVTPSSINPSSNYPEGSIGNNSSANLSVHLPPSLNSQGGGETKKKFNIFKPNFILKLSKKPTRGASSRVFSSKQELFNRSSSKIANTPKALRESQQEKQMSFASMAIMAVSQ